MCGRFAITLPADAMSQLFAATPSNDVPDVPNYNVCPTTRIHVVLNDDGRKLQAMRWGFIPKWYKSPNDGPLLINARGETIADKPAFREACRTRRCLIPTTGFYEWTKTPEGDRLPWYIHRADRAPLVFAGVWQTWGEGEDRVNTCAIVTTAANDAMSKIHHRMPVVLEPEAWGKWLGEQGKGAATLMTCAAEHALEYYRVDRAVNSNRAVGPQLVLPLDRPED